MPLRPLRPEEAGSQPPLRDPAYKSNLRRAPAEALVAIPDRLRDLAAPVYGYLPLGDADADLTRQHGGEPLGERIIVAGRVLDEDGRPLRQTLVELWQCNAAGRYRHARDTHPAPIDPNFSGAGRAVTDADGWYRFTTIKPGAYPWANHPNAWRPAHIHFSLFGRSLESRLVTQMYFPNDPLCAYDPMFQSVRDPRARQRLVSNLDLALTEPDWALGYRFDIVLRGPGSTPFEGRV